MPRSRYYHPDYRMAEASAIVQAIDRGQAVAVVGPPSIGKSNLLRFLDQDRLEPNDPQSPWLRYAPHAQQDGRIVAISIDPNALLPALPAERGTVAAQAWPGFELLAHRTSLVGQLYPRYFGDPDDDMDDDLPDQITGLQRRFANAHPDITDVEDALHAHLALRHLERLLDAILRSHRLQGRPIRLVYFMDEFERLLEAMPDYFFVALRSLRDRFKYQVMFATFTRNTLPYLIGEERLARIEPFVELFHDNTIYMKPFSDADAWRMIEQLENRAVSKNDYGLGLLMRATGNFAGLLRAGFHHVEMLEAIQTPEYQQAVDLAADQLATQDNVQAECQTLLRGLNDEEIQALYQQPAPDAARRAATMRELIHKSLLEPGSRDGVHITPPVLAAYVRKNPKPPPPRPAAPPVTHPK